MILERAAAAQEQGRVSRAEVERRYDIPANVLARLEELEVLTPNSRGYDADDVKIIEAISRFRAGGYVEELGFTVYDTLRYREALEPLVKQEVDALLERLAGEVEPDEAAEIIAAGHRAAARPDRGDALQAAPGRAPQAARPRAAEPGAFARGSARGAAQVCVGRDSAHPGRPGQRRRRAPAAGPRRRRD